MTEKNKTRLDTLLFQRGLVRSRSHAQALIMSGDVLVNDQPIIKPGISVFENSQIRIRNNEHAYVSRGGQKLASALDQFKVSCENKIGLDIGASTGGFTDVLLQRGAAKVYAVDVGSNQMDWKIRSNPKVKVIEKLNARNITFEHIGEVVDIIVVDVSFISLEKILKPLLILSKSSTDWITLIKPQFEVGKGKVGKGGIIREESDRQEVITRIKSYGESIGLNQLGLIESPIKGTDGNQEYLAHWKQSTKLNS